MYLNTDHGDDLSDLIGAPKTINAEPKVTPPTTYIAPDYSEPCKKCHGSGVFRGWSGRTFGPCFACKGKGKNTFKTSPEARSANRARAAAKAQTKADERAREVGEKIETFKVEHAAEYAWMIQKTESFEFAASMLTALLQWGSLTAGQLAAVQRCIEKDKTRATERAEREANAPAADTAGVDRLKAAFDAAAAYTAAKGKGLTLRSPKITIGDMTISPAKAESKNAGALYVKAGAQYLGKITAGKFFAVRECSPEQQAKVLAFVADPKAAAEAYGQETGVCCMCNATLTSEWRLRGIGPICATKYGW